MVEKKIGGIYYGGKKEKNTHGFVSNFKFMVGEQWNFEKKGVIMPFIRIPSSIIVSMLIVLLPKVVIDAIDKSVSPYVFTWYIGVLTIILMIMTYIEYYTEQSIYMLCENMEFTFLSKKGLENSRHGLFTIFIFCWEK